jgi:hypothetical protein
VTPADWVAPWAEDRLREVPDRFAFAGVRFEVVRPAGAAPLRLPACLGHPMAETPGPIAGTVRVKLEMDATLPRGRGRRGFAAELDGDALRVSLGRAEAHLVRGLGGAFEGTARLAVDTGGAAEMDLLQALAGAVVSASGGAVLHAAAVALGGRACLYVGPPDAGKSTACAHTAGPLLAIDRVALVAGDGGALTAWAVPGGPEDEHAGERACPPVAPAACILRVVQARGEVRATRLAPAQGVMVVRSAMQWPLRGAEEAALEAAARVAGASVVGEIHTVLGQPNATAVRALLGYGG